MKSFMNVLENSICHIIIDGLLESKFLLITNFISTLQTMACIVDPNSTLYLLVKWTDPSTFLDPSFSIVISLVIIFSFLLVIIVKTIMTEDSQMLTKPTTLKIYVGNLFLHLQMLCKTIIVNPLIRGCILQIKNPSSAALEWLGVAGMLIYLIFLFPIVLYNSSNTFILTPQINKKLNYINIYLIGSIFRVIFAAVSAINQSMIIIPCSMFFAIFMIQIIKQPIFMYNNEKIAKGMFSIVAYVSVCPLLEFIMNQEFNSLLVQILGIICFVTFIEWLTQFRLRKILDLPKPTIHQIKILIFLIINMEDYLQKLEYFILKHHKECTHVGCKCSAVVQLLASVDGKFNNDKIWFQFLICYTGNYYSLQKIEKLPETEMMQQTVKYSRIVIDLAEIHLFKLGQVNQSYYIVNGFRHHLQIKGISFLSFQLKRKIINYYMQEEIIMKYKTDGVANQYADKYMNFQIEYQKYRKMLLRSANMTADMWQQMNKRQPDDEKLHKCIKVLQRWYWRIRGMYQSISADFDKSAQILENITNQYFQSVLNIPEKSPFHVIQAPKFQNFLRKKEEKVEKISQNMQAFSFNSETPVCYVSVDEDHFGKIMGNNYFFNQTMKMEFGKVANLQDFMIPEMRAHHQVKMKRFIRGDGFSIEHKNGFTLNTKGKIVYTKILVQIMPSILEGLRYVFYLRKLMPRRKILGVKNNLTMAYSSQSFDEAFEQKIRKEPVLSYLTEQVLRQVRKNKQIKIMIEEQEFFIKYLHEFTYNEMSYLFLEFYEEEDIQMETKWNLLGEKADNAMVKESDLFKSTNNSRRASILDPNIGGEEKKELEKSDVLDKTLNQKLKKEQEGIREVYSLIIDNNKKNITRRVIIFTLIIFILFIAALLTSIFLKQNNQSAYLQAATINTDYNSFMLLMARAVTYAKLINIKAYQNNTQVAKTQLNILNNLTNINPIMDQLVVNFNIVPITQTWSYFNWNNNGSFQVGQEGNFLTVSDFIQNPLTNIITQSISSLSFPIARQYMSLPLTTGQFQLQQLVTNSLYITLPNFRSLKASVMDPIIYSSVNTKVMMLMVFLSQILIVGSFVVGMLVINKRVTELKNESYKLFESLSKQLIKEKENKCRQFVCKFTAFDEDTEENGESFLRRTSRQRQETQVQLQYSSASRNLEKIFHEQTEHDLGVNFSSGRTSHNIIINSNLDIDIKQFNQDANKDSQLVEDLKLNGLTNQKGGGVVAAKKEEIFEKSSIRFVLFKYLLPVIPLMLFSIVFGCLEVSEVNKINNFLNIQSKIQTIQLDINLIQLYALQYGVYDPTLQIYQSIPATLSYLINEMYLIERSLVGKSYDLSSLPITEQFINSIGYSNLCNMFQAGDFINGSIFNNTFNASECMGIGNMILEKGFYSSMISYLEGVSTLMLAFPNMPLANLSQRLQYLNSEFFMQDSQLIGYFDSIITTILSFFQEDYANIINNSTNYLVYTALGMLALLLLLAISFNCLYIESFKYQIIEITAIFLFVSYKSILKTQALKNQFTEKMEAFKKLK